MTVPRMGRIFTSAFPVQVSAYIIYAAIDVYIHSFHCVFCAEWCLLKLNFEFLYNFHRRYILEAISFPVYFLLYPVAKYFVYIHDNRCQHSG